MVLLAKVPNPQRLGVAKFDSRGKDTGTIGDLLEATYAFR